MGINITAPNSGSDYLEYKNAAGTSLAKVGGYDDGSSNGHLEIYTTASGTSTERMRVTSAGNIGIGVTPTTTSLGPSIQLGNQMTLTSFNGNSCYFDNNIYYNGGFKYTGNGYGFSMRMTDGNLLFSNAPNNSSGAGAAATLTECMRINSSGNLLVGKTSSNPATPGCEFNTYGAILTRSAGDALLVNRETSDGTAVTLRRSNTTVGTISVTTSATAYNTSSDYRLKENIQPMQGALDVVVQLNPVTYNWKADGSDGQGFIAHELQAVVPDCVTGEKDAVDEEGKPVYQGIDTSFLTATLSKAIQELHEIVKNQAAEIAELKAKIA